MCVCVLKIDFSFCFELSEQLCQMHNANEVLCYSWCNVGSPGCVFSKWLLLLCNNIGNRKIIIIKGRSRKNNWC